MDNQRVVEMAASSAVGPSGLTEQATQHHDAAADGKPDKRRDEGQERRAGPAKAF
ncbi:MAG: hypothetical protein IMW96_04750 [Thermoanaerobacteraceae bacterium]|nr:hypothetical protein [Thermoanaerobacteraceae bacterium]